MPTNVGQKGCQVQWCHYKARVSNALLWEAKNNKVDKIRSFY